MCVLYIYTHVRICVIYIHIHICVVYVLICVNYTCKEPCHLSKERYINVYAMYIYMYICICICVCIFICMCLNTWQSWELAWTMNWVDWLRTSADKRTWSGRRAVVMRTGRRSELLGVKLVCPRSRCRAVVSDVLCVRSYVHFVCVCVYMCMCVCVRT